MLIVKIRDKATEVKVRERESGQPKLPTEGSLPPHCRPICRKCGGSKSLGKERQNRLVQRGEFQLSDSSRWSF